MNEPNSGTLAVTKQRVTKGLRSPNVSERHLNSLRSLLTGGCLGVREEVTLSLSKGCQ